MNDVFIGQTEILKIASFFKKIVKRFCYLNLLKNLTVQFI